MIYTYIGYSNFLLKMAFISLSEVENMYISYGKAMNIYIFYFTSEIKAKSINKFEFSFYYIQPI